MARRGSAQAGRVPGMVAQINGPLRRVTGEDRIRLTALPKHYLPAELSGTSPVDPVPAGPAFETPSTPAITWG